MCITCSHTDDMALMLNSPKLVPRRLLYKNNASELRVSNESQTDKSQEEKTATDNAAFQGDTLEMTEICLEDSNGSVRNETDNKALRDLTEDGKPCSNPEWRGKVFRTTFVLFSYLTVGMLYGQFGPTLPDLQKISGVGLEKASWIFTSFAIGYLCGCLLGGYLFEKFDAYLLLFLYSFGYGVFTIVLPWIPEFFAMIANRIIIGILIGGHDTATHTVLLQIWVDQGGRFIHLTHIVASVGGTVSSFLTEPFVLPLQMEITKDSLLNITSGVNDSASQTGNTSNMTSETILVPNTESNIHYAFLITGLISAVSSIPMLYIFTTAETQKTLSNNENESIEEDRKLPTKVKYVILVILNVISCLGTALIDLFPSFLTTFLIEQLGWEQSTGTIVTSIYFLMYALGNLLSAIFYNKIRTSLLMAISLTTSIGAIVGLLVAIIIDGSILIWVTVALMGLSISAALPSLFSWTQSKVTQVTGRISSAFLFSGSAGVMANPLIMGYFMDNFSPMWFIYFSLGEPFVCVILFTLAYLLQRVYSVRKDMVKETCVGVEVNFSNDSGNARIENTCNIKEAYTVRL